MISPRILFEGDPAEAYRYVGVAKEFGRSTFAAGILSKVWRLGENVHIRVMNNIQARVCKVWITAGDSGLWYQFITTGPEITSYSGEGFSVYKGSAVAVKLPKIKTDGSVVWDNVTPIATGSSLEILPDETPISDDTAAIQRVNGVVQVQLVSEPSYRYHKYIDRSSSYGSYKQLIHSWSSMPGIIYNAGAFMLSPSFTFTDEGYDIPPLTISGKKLKGHEPDMDWPHDAAILRVTSEEFGSRSFIVAVDASSRFYCWPYQSDEFSDLGSEYAEQSQRITVPNSKIQSLEAPFPSWVYVPVGDRRDTDFSFGVNSGEPRYVWRFHPQGTKVVGLVLQRESFTGTVYGQTLSDPTYLKFTQVEVGDVGLDFDTSVPLFSKRTDISGTHDLQNDSPGYVEFSIDLALTGSEENDFTFGLTLLREQPSDETHYPIAADYLCPVLGGWAAYGVSGNPGDLVVLDLKGYYSERDQTWIARHCGYLDIANHYLRQSFLKIVNIESNTELLSLCTKDWPTDFSILRAQLDTLPLTIHEGQLSSIDLGKLSFVYQVTKTVLTANLEVAMDSEPDYDAFQKSAASQIGLRYFVFGKKVYESSHGEDLDLWTSLDAINEVVMAYNPLETATRWLMSKNTRIYNVWWLNSLFSGTLNIRNAIFGETFNVGDVSSVEAWNEETETYSKLFSFYSRSFFSNEMLRNEIIRLFSTLSSAVGSVNWTSQEFEYTHSSAADSRYIDPIRYVTTNYIGGMNSISHSTNVFTKMTENCPSCQETYLDDVFIPWVHEMLENNQLRGEVESVFLGYAEYPYDSLINYGDTEIEYPGYYYDSINLDLLKWVQMNLMFDYNPTDIYLSTYLENNVNQRIYDYPIGKEIFMREWTRAIRQGTPMSLVCPEGFYAGVNLQVPYTTGTLPYCVMFALPGKQKEHRNYGLFLNNGFFSEFNEPDLSQFHFATFDLLSHVNSETVETHQSLYEAAYQHSLMIEDPLVRIRIEDDNAKISYNEYVYEKQYTFNGVTSWFPFYTKMLGIDDFLVQPILNGSMLFSK